MIEEKGDARERIIVSLTLHMVRNAIMEPLEDNNTRTPATNTIQETYYATI
jgi:hypothetical protein